MKDVGDVSYIRINSATVEFPLRGLRGGNSDDPRIIRHANGKISIQPLRDLSLEVASGDRIGILGANGAGKTTLLKVVAGILPLSKGSIEISGSLHSVLSIGDGLRSALTGRENTVLRYYFLGEPNGSEIRFVQDVASFAELGDFFDLPISTYSPGMLGRLMFAMSTVVHSDILIMDEWLGVSDADFQSKAAKRLHDLVNANDIFMIASHSRAILKQTTNKIVRLEDGGIKSVIATADLDA